MSPIAFVRAVYFDTSVIRKFSLGGLAEGLATLRKIAAQSAVELFAPEVCVRELVGYHKRSIAEQLQEFDQVFERLQPYLSPGTSKPGRPSCISTEVIRSAVEGDLGEAGVTLVPMPSVSVGDLVDMAVERCPPFDAGGRGFRDAVILETILEHARSFAGFIAILATADKDFDERELRRRGEGIGIKLMRASGLDALGSLINDKLWKAAVELHGEEQNALLEFLRSRGDEVLSQLRSKLEPSEDFLLGKGRFSESGGTEVSVFLMLPSVERIEGYRFGEFGPGTLAGGLLAKRQPGREYFEITVEAEFDVVISAVPLLLEFKRLTLPTVSSPREARHPSFERKEQRSTLKRTVAFTVSIARGPEGEFEDPRVERCDV